MRHLHGASGFGQSAPFSGRGPSTLGNIIFLHHFYIGKLKIHTWVAVLAVILALTLIIGVASE
jgi:hypothetical protein